MLDRAGVRNGKPWAKRKAVELAVNARAASTHRKAEHWCAVMWALCEINRVFTFLVHLSELE